MRSTDSKTSLAFIMPFLYGLATIWAMYHLFSIDLIPEFEGNKDANVKIQNRYLMYITTHLSESHLDYFKLCWPALLASSRLYKQLDFMVYVSHSDPEYTDRSLIESIFAETNITIHLRPNPGYNEGAVLAMTEAFRNGWFDGYDWIIRVNPDVLIRNDTILLDILDKQDVDGVFVDCIDIPCPTGNKCIDRQIHTDFFAVRPQRIPANVFERSLNENAETMATAVFSSIVKQGKDSWLPGTGPHLGYCRVNGESSSVIHTHDFDKIYPACLWWYDR